MEHRFTERKPADLNVVISCPRVGMFRGRIRNLSLGGMYVESGCVVMPIHAPVQVSIQPDPERPIHSLDIPGMVVQQRGNAFGLIFGELDLVTKLALRDLLDSLSAPCVANL